METNSIRRIQVKLRIKIRHLFESQEQNVSVTNLVDNFLTLDRHLLLTISKIHCLQSINIKATLWSFKSLSDLVDFLLEIINMDLILKVCYFCLEYS